MIKVSVVIPVYRVEKQIERCISSVLGQSYKNVEIIFIDDGSPDNSGFICDLYASNDDRITVIHQKNQGVSAARNRALTIATGDYVMFLDGDDAFDTETVKTCVLDCEDGKWDVVTFGFHQLLDNNGDITLLKETPYEKAVYENAEALKCDFIDCYKKGIWDFVTDKMTRAVLIKDNGILFNGSFNVGGEDALFMMELFPHLKNLKITENVFYRYYRRSGESITLTFHPDKFKRYYERLTILYDLMKRIGKVDKDFIVYKIGVYFLWSYESMLSAGCRLGFFERLRYIKSDYRPKEIFKGQKNIAAKIFKDKTAFNDYCLSSRVALRLFYKRQVFLLWCWQTLTDLLSKRRKNK